MELTQRNSCNTWNPFELLADFGGYSLKPREDWARAFQPDIELRENADSYELSADLPGFKKEDFDISVQGNVITLKGERKQEKESKEKGYYFSEKTYGTFSRSLEFPTDIQADKVKASYKDGVLEIALPKAESAKPKQINVEVK